MKLTIDFSSCVIIVIGLWSWSYCRANVIAESSESEMLLVLLGNTWFYTSWVLGVLEWKLVRIPLEKGSYSKKFYLIFEAYGRKIARSILHFILFSLNVFYLKRGKLIFVSLLFSPLKAMKKMQIQIIKWYL